MKKLFAVLLALVLVFSFAACGEDKKDGKYNIGICQFVQHPALDKATQGFIDAVEKGLGKENVTIDNQNASEDAQACSTIVNKFLSSKVDLIMANATPALQAAAAATNKTPILGTSVTHYAPALEIDVKDWNGTVGGNISGTSDLADLKAQASMILEWFPNTKKVALLFCSAEANSIFQVAEVTGYLKEMGIETKEFTFSSTEEVASITLEACKYADVIYVPTDNKAASNAEAIANVVLAENVPVITGEQNCCASFGVATLSIDYYDLGVKTGEMAVEILKNGKDISTMAIEYAPAAKFYNKTICEKYGLTIPEGYSPLE